jgi:hypothetical protein
LGLVLVFFPFFPFFFIYLNFKNWGLIKKRNYVICRKINETRD